MTGAFLVAVLRRCRARLPLFLHRHAAMPLQQLGPGAGGPKEALRLHLQEASHPQVQ